MATFPNWRRAPNAPDLRILLLGILQPSSNFLEQRHWRLTWAQQFFPFYLATCQISRPGQVEAFAIGLQKQSNASGGTTRKRQR